MRRGAVGDEDGDGQGGDGVRGDGVRGDGEVEGHGDGVEPTLTDGEAGRSGGSLCVCVCACLWVCLGVCVRVRVRTLKRV